MEVVSGGKCPPLAADTEVNNCFSIYESSEIIEHKIKMMDFLKPHLLLPTTKFGTQMSYFLADKLHFSRHLFSYYGKISVKGFYELFLYLKPFCKELINLVLRLLMNMSAK